DRRHRRVPRFERPVGHGQHGLELLHRVELDEVEHRRGGQRRLVVRRDDCAAPVDDRRPYAAGTDVDGQDAGTGAGTAATGTTAATAAAHDRRPSSRAASSPPRIPPDIDSSATVATVATTVRPVSPSLPSRRSPRTRWVAIRRVSQAVNDARPARATWV